jgi:hypothetical protein
VAGALPASAAPPPGGARRTAFIPLVSRESKRWKSLYRGRASVEHEFGRLKNEWALLPLRVRGSSGFGSMPI